MRKLILIMALACSLGLTAQQNHVYYMFIDLTDATLVDTFKDQIKEVVPSILRKHNVKDGNGVEFKFFSISNLRQGVKAKISMDPREIPWYENENIRLDEVESFRNRLPNVLNKFMDAEYPHTRIVDAVQSEMSRFKSTKAKSKTIIVFSDLFENYTDEDTEVLDWDNIYFVRGISDPFNQKYVEKGDAMEIYWRTRIPNVIINTELEL